MGKSKFQQKIEKGRDLPVKSPFSELLHRKKDVIYGVNSTFSTENLSEPAQLLKSLFIYRTPPTIRFRTSLSISVTSDRMTRAESSDSGGLSLYQSQSERSAPAVAHSLDDLEPETSSEQSENYLERWTGDYLKIKI